MIKLNLLPAHVLERQKVKRFIFIVAALFGLEVAGLVMMILNNTTLAKKLNKELTEKQAQRKEVEAIQAKAKAKQDQIKPFENTVDFVARLAGDRDYDPPGVQWANLIDLVIRYTYDRAQYSEVRLARNGIGVRGQVDSAPAYVRYVMNLERCPSLGDVRPSVSLGAPRGPVSFSVNCSLSNPIQTPGLSGGGGGGGMGGMGMMGGMPGMGGMGMGGGMGGGMEPGMAGASGSGPPMGG